MSVVIVLLLLPALLGADCDDDYETTPTNVDRSDVAPLQDGALWLSDPWDMNDPAFEGLIEIPPSSRIRLYHGLGRTPVEIQAYVGFAPDAQRVMVASGNSVEIWEVNDEYVLIRNGSGGSFYYRFLLR